MKNVWVLSALVLGPAAASFAQVTTPLGGATGMNTTYGPTGLINVPTAFTARDKEARVGGTWGKDISGPSVNFGLLPYIEIGGAHMIRRGTTDKTVASGKITLLPSNFNWLAVGIGIIDPFDAINQTGYVVGSVDLIRPDVESPTGAQAIALRAHAGMGTGMFRERLIGGAELIFADRFSAVAEYDARNFNAAVRYKASNDVQLQAGFHDKGIFFGVTAPVRF